VRGFADPGLNLGRIVTRSVGVKSQNNISHYGACSIMCAGGSGLIPGADNLGSGFHPSVLSKMSSNLYVMADRYINLLMELKRATL
jgi:hypothetical protein